MDGGSRTIQRSTYIVSRKAKSAAASMSHPPSSGASCTRALTRGSSSHSWTTPSYVPSPPLSGVSHAEFALGIAGGRSKPLARSVTREPRVGLPHRAVPPPARYAPDASRCRCWKRHPVASRQGAPVAQGSERGRCIFSFDLCAHMLIIRLGHSKRAVDRAERKQPAF